MFIQNEIKMMSSYGASLIKKSMIQKLTTHQIKIAIIVSIAMSFIAAIVFAIVNRQWNKKTLEVHSDESVKARRDVAKSEAKPRAKVLEVREEEVALKRKAEREPRASIEVSQVNRDVEVVQERAKKERFRIIKASDYSGADLEGQINRVIATATDCSLSNFWYSNPAKEVTFLAVKGEGTIVGFLCGKHFDARNYFYDRYEVNHVVATTSFACQREGEVETSLMREAIRKAKGLGIETLSGNFAFDHSTCYKKKIDFCHSLKKLNVDVDESNGYFNGYGAEWEFSPKFDLHS